MTNLVDPQEFISRKILVTGASGVMGSGVARALVAAGADVTVLQRSPSGIPGVHEVLGSITDQTVLDQAVAGKDTVVHIAAKVSMTGDPKEFHTINVQGTGLLLESARRAGVQRWIHISSPSVAHTGTSLAGDRANPADPKKARGEYARTKAAGELLALEADASDFRVLVLRPHLMWGPGDTQLTERIIDRSRDGRLPILGTGAALVDTLFTENAVDSVLAAVRAVDHHHGEALVVTNGEPRPVGELLRSIAVAGGAPEPELKLPAGLAKAAGAAIEVVWDKLDQDDEPPLTRFLAEQLSTAHWFDQRRTREVLNWTPRVSIAQGLEITRQYYADK